MNFTINIKDKVRERFCYYREIVSAVIILIFAPIITLPRYIYEYFENMVYAYKEGVKMIRDFIMQSKAARADDDIRFRRWKSNLKIHDCHFDEKTLRAIWNAMDEEDK